MSRSSASAPLLLGAERRSLIERAPSATIRKIELRLPRSSDIFSDVLIRQQSSVSTTTPGSPGVEA